MPTSRPLVMKTLIASTLLVCTGAVFAQAYPSRPVQLLVPFPAGAPVDTLARAFAQALDRLLNQSVPVVNRDGGSNTIAMNALLTAPADGHTILYGPVTALTVHPHWMPALQYKVDSFVAVCQTFENVFVLAGGPNSNLRDFAGVAAQAKAKPGGVTYAHPGVSSSPHLAGAELFQRSALPATDVPFRGEAAMVGALREGAVDLGVVTTGFAVNQALKPLAVFADKRLSNFPETPTVRELGYNVLPSGYGGLFMRADTPAPIVARIEEACKGAVSDSAFRDMAQRQFQQTEFLDRLRFTARLQADAKAKGELLKTVKLER